MAKRTTTPPAPEPDGIDESLILVAEMLLSEHFFDPGQEQAYKQRLSANRAAGTEGVLLEDDTIELTDGACELRIEALRTWTHFRVGFVHPAFEATVEGTWSFETEELRQTRVKRTGDSETIEVAVEELIEEIEGPGLDDEEFAGFIDGLDDEDDEEVPLIGDDPTEPPDATPLDRNRVKAIAKRIARKPAADIAAEDRSWLEETPQVLPVIVEALIGAASAAKHDEALILAYQVLLALQLEFVRYRQDRGWEWASDMIDAFLDRLVVLGNEATIPRDDWFMMCNALTEARVPLSDSVLTALAEAGFKPDDDDGPPEQMMRTLRGFMDELAKMVSSPFEVIYALQNAGAMLPATLRGFMATELALSPHQTLRDAVPLMLLDEDPSVRKGAAGALEQTAHPETMSPDTLRRAIALRNWIPAGDRPPLDAAIRKARLAGVEIGAWPAPVPGLEFHASTIDGSGAQSLFAVGCPGKKGFFGGLLIRLGVGVVDTWADHDLTRGKINKLLREAKMQASSFTVDKAFIDTMVQHAIGTAVEQENVPPTLLLEMAELFGGAEWKDRRLDIKAEADRLFETLDAGDRSPEAVEAGLAHGLDWMSKDDAFSSWFEDGPMVQKTLAKLPRTDRIGMVALVMTDILPPKRADWAERFLMMALWSRAVSEAKQQVKARDLMLVAHGLAGDGPIGAIPMMAVIAMQTVRATLLGGW
ncbi:hypothetical protein [Acidisphaera sp. S103]|uniref:hypothetical protein n=1 Tax=Acidisphaera sp. S103 TaxID=1747223 RepID=UPI00131A9FDD|nr:hypothetical protein [Acidisphaera sp. S103]